MKAFSWIRSGGSKWITHTLTISIILVILFGTTIYFVGSWIVQQEIHRSSQESLSQVLHQVETKINNVEQMTNQMVLNTHIIDLMNIQLQPRLGATMESNRVQNYLSVASNSTDDIHSVYFYHFPQEIVIGANFLTSVYENRVFADTSWLRNVEEMVENRQQRIWVAPREMTNVSEQTSSVLSHISILPLFYSQPRAVLVVNMKPDFLVDTISRFPLGSEGRLLIMNRENQVIAQVQTAGMRDTETEQVLAAIRSYDGNAAGSMIGIGSVYVSTMKSESNGWKYAMIIPSNVPRQHVEFFKWMIILITAVLCILVVYSAYFSHSRFQRGIKLLLDRLSVSKPLEHEASSQDALFRLESHINSLVKEVKEGRDLQKENLPLLKAHFLYACLHNNSVDLSRLSSRESELGLFPHTRFCVLAVEMDPDEEGRFANDRALFLFAVSNIVMELTDLLAVDNSRIESILTHQYTVIVINYETEAVTAQDLDGFANRLRLVVAQLLKHTVTIGIGSTVQHVRQVVHSYQEALQSLRMNWANARNTVLHYSQVSMIAEKLVQYPSAEEQALLLALRSRDREEAVNGLLRFGGRIQQEPAAPNMAKTFYLQLLVAVIKQVQEYEDDISQVFGGSNPYESFFHKDSLEQIQLWFIKEAIEPILVFMESVRRSRTEIVIRNTVELIHTRYKDDLSLQFVADQVGISASYLSQLFKDETGENFIDYVTQVRLDKATQLLMHTDLNLKQVAEEIGYTSVQQLFRVFRKKLGMTPGEYRDKHGSA